MGYIDIRGPLARSDLAASIDTGAIAKAIGAKFVEHYGAIGDGTSHPLSERFGTLGAAQAVYPHAAALTDETDWAAIMLAINSGGALLSERPYYLGANRLTGQAGDFILMGPPGTSYRDWGNGGIEYRARSGAFLIYTGTGNAVDPAPDVATRIAIQHLAVQIPTTSNACAIRVQGNKWFNSVYTDKSAQLAIREVGLFTTRGGAGFGDNAAISLECTDLEVYRAFFGAEVSNVYAYGFREGLRLHVVTPTDTSGGRSNWINGNTFRNIQGYQCFRGLNLIGGVGDSCITANLFEGISNQYGVDSEGASADGYAVTADGAVVRNTFTNVNGFDAPTNSWKVTNFPNVTNKQTWNTATNCLDVEPATAGLYIYGHAPLTFTPELRINNSAAGITWSGSLEGRVSLQGDLVAVQVAGTLASKGSSAGEVAIAGLPLPSAAANNLSFPLVGHHAFFAGPISNVAARLGPASTALQLIKGNPADDTYVLPVTDADLTGGGQFNLSFTYLR